MEKGRTLYQKDWFSNQTMLYFWVSILFMADESGSFVTSLNTLAKELRLSVQQVRTCLSNIESNKLITHLSTKQGTKVTICNFDNYKTAQQSEQQTLQQTINTPGNKPKEAPLVPPDGSPLNNSPSFTPYNPPQESLKESSVTDVPEDEKRGKPVSPPPDFSFVLKLWNDSATRSIPKVRMLSPARKEKVRLRIKEMGGMEEAKEILATCFKKISESDFCNGATGKWTATFDWFFENEKNWLKVLEGNYDNRKEKSRLEQLAKLYKQGNEYYEQQYRGYGGASPYGDPPGGGDYGPDEQ